MSADDQRIFFLSAQIGTLQLKIARVRRVEHRRLEADDAAAHELFDFAVEVLQAGLRPVAVSGRITRSSHTYAQYMLAHDVWAHASHIKVRGFRRVGEILGMAPAHVTIAQVVEAWLQSPVHRSVMLDPRFRYFGIASATGSFQGEKATVWVVRFGA